MQDTSRAAHEVLRESVRAWRRANKVTQAELAECAGVTQCFVSQVESGKRSVGLASLERLARAMGSDIAGITTEK